MDGKRTELRDSIVGERTLYEGRAYDFVELMLRQPDGVERPRPIVRHRGAVVIVPLLETPGRSSKVVFVVNDRHAINGRLEELPAGGIDPGETADEAAARELGEETGFVASALHPLGTFYTTPGMTDEVMHAYVGLGLTPRPEGQDLQPDESLSVKQRSSGDALEAVANGTLRDGKTMLALLLAQSRGYL
ncbi:MAG: NUDIX hydrolase [Planctomycetota bacterium]